MNSGIVDAGAEQATCKTVGWRSSGAPQAHLLLSLRKPASAEHDELWSATRSPLTMESRKS